MRDGTVARLCNPGADSALRGYLVAEARAFRRQHVEILLDPEHPEWAEYAWAETSKRVDQLEAGKPCRITRYDLPEGHPARALGAITDDLLLGADDVLYEADSRLQVRA